MSLSEEQVQAAAKRLFDAETTGVQTGLLSQLHPDMNLDDAYAVQEALVQKKISAGSKITGRKIGLTSKAMQRALNIETPDSGVLFDHMHFDSGATIPTGQFIEPRVEAEIAFIMQSAISGSDVTRDDIIDATASVAAAIEILDTRILRADPTSGKPRIITDTVSDNAANAGVVLADTRHAVDAFDLRRVGAIVKRNGTVEETGMGAGVLDDPITSMVWLVQRLAQYDDGLAAGDIVLSGSFVRPIEATPGSHIDADFGDFGQVTLQFNTGPQRY